MNQSISGPDKLQAYSFDPDVFRGTLRLWMTQRKMTAAQLSRDAGLNLRAVTDILDGRVASPKVSTVFGLANALQISPTVLLGLGPTAPDLPPELGAFLSQLDPEVRETVGQKLASLAEVLVSKPSAE